MKLTLCALSIMAISIVANGDTLTFTNNSSLNGSVRYENGVFYIQADYRGGTQHYAIPRDQVTSDEINNETFNQGAPLPDIRAHQVDHYDWVAINTQSAPLKTRTKTAQRMDSPEIAAANRKPSAASAKIGALVDPIPASGLSPGQDTLTFTNHNIQKGTLRRMTSSTIIFRANGEGMDTEYDRDQVKLVKVKKT